MRPWLLLAGIIILFSLAAAPAHAALTPLPMQAALSPFYQGNQDPCPNATTVDECFYAPTPTNAGDYSYCQALGFKGQMCAWSLWDGSHKVCAWRSVSGNCQCKDGVATGTCTYVK